jgi:hypothetical protein
MPAGPAKHGPNTWEKSRKISWGSAFSAIRDWLEAVKKDPSGIAYNNIGYAYDSKTKLPNPGIKVIPLDNQQ